MSNEHDVDDVDESEGCNDETIMWFGQHKGKKLRDLDDAYLYWLYETPWLRSKFPDLYDYCVERLEDYDPEAK